MEQYIEFAGNHPIMVAALLGIIGMIIYVEFDRLTSGIRAITPMEAIRLQNDDAAIFIDVRTTADYREGHILGARHIPVEDIDKRKEELLKHKDKTVVCYCAIGMSARKPARVLKKAGLDKAGILAGGLEAWQKASLPLVSK